MLLLLMFMLIGLLSPLTGEWLVLFLVDIESSSSLLVVVRCSIDLFLLSMDLFEIVVGVVVVVVGLLERTWNGVETRHIAGLVGNQENTHRDHGVFFVR